MRRLFFLGALGVVSAALGVVGCVEETKNPATDAGVDSPAAPKDAAGPLPDAVVPDAASGSDAGADAEVKADAADVDATTGGDAGADSGADTDAAADATIGADAAVDAGAADATVSDAAVDAGAVDAGNNFSSSPSVSLKAARQGHTATRLPDGRVLFTGGYAGLNAGLASAEVYTPGTNAFTTLAATMNVGRQSHTATLLESGKVLIAGGSGAVDGGGAVLDSAEIFDPQTNTFTMVTARMTKPRSIHGAALLPGGRVLLVGGAVGNGAGDNSTDTAEIFDPGADPVQGTFTSTPTPMNMRRMLPLTVALPNGTVLVAGGRYGNNPPVIYESSAETFDPAGAGGAGAFTMTVNGLAVGRINASVTLMGNGQVLIAGGYSSTHAVETDVYDPATRSFTAGPALPSGRAYHAAAPLPSGGVLLVGGTGPSGVLDSALVYQPPAGAGAGTLVPVASKLVAARGLPSVTSLLDGRVLVAGGQLGSGFITSTVDFFTE